MAITSDNDWQSHLPSVRLTVIFRSRRNFALGLGIHGLEGTFRGCILDYHNP